MNRIPKLMVFACMAGCATPGSREEESASSTGQSVSSSGDPSDQATTSDDEVATISDDCVDDFSGTDLSPACFEALHAICAVAGEECTATRLPSPAASDGQDWRCAVARVIDYPADGVECEEMSPSEQCLAFEYSGGGGFGTDPCPDFAPLTTLYYITTSAGDVRILRPPSAAAFGPLHPIGYEWCTPGDGGPSPALPECQCAEAPICAE